jgi:hypothetical protein
MSFFLLIMCKCTHTAILPSLKTERIEDKIIQPWKPNLKSKIEISIAQESKEKQKKIHQEKVKQLIQDKRNKRLIIYSDGSKSESGIIGSGIFHLNESQNSELQYWNLGQEMEVFDAELFAIEKSFKWAAINCHKNIKEI